jgi:magnesium-transporting ATPase (P-type)
MKTSVIEVHAMLSVLRVDEMEKRIGEVPAAPAGDGHKGHAAPGAPLPPLPPAMVKAGRLDDPSVRNADEVARALGTDINNGLTSPEASRRLAQDGPNELRSAPRRPAWRRLLAHFQDPLVYLLLAAIAIALGAWVIEGWVGWPVDAIVIGAIVLLNGVLGYVQEARAENAVAALARMTAVSSAVLRDGQVLRVPSAELVRGDLLVLGEGDAVGADARLLLATSLRVQEASLTGESEAVLKDAATLRDPVALGDRLDMVFKGTAVAQGTGRGVVTATGMDTEMGAIAEMLEATQEEPTPLQKEVARIGRMLGIAVVVIAVVAVATILLMSNIRSAADIIDVLLLGVALAVAAVPEGLPAILTVVLALGVQRMAKHNAIVKNLSSVETLGSASVIASDKTGTLTRSEMTIERVMTASGGTHVTGVGYAPYGQVEHEGARLGAGPLHAEHVVVLSGGSLAGNADLRQAAGGEWEIHGDPTEAAFLVAERKLGVTAVRERRFERIGEIPFTSERKMMSTIELDHEHNDELVVISKGAPDVLLDRCTRVRVGMELAALDDTLRARILADVDTLSDAALRPLAVAYRPLGPDEDPQATESFEQNLIFVGTVGIFDPPRQEAAVAIREAHRAGIRVIMITGDHPRTAARIAADLGIVEPGAPALTGLELDALDEAAFAEAVRKTSVYARVAPTHKLRIIDALQADGNVVAMTGDGVNDAPALKSADIGIAMGVTGTEVTKEAARLILADDNFATIVEAVREGRAIFDNIRKFLRYLLSSNMGEVLTVFLGVVGAGVIGLTGADDALVLPLLATQILWINLITDSAPALAMGVDPSTADVMARKPRRMSERAIDAPMWATVIQIGLVMAVVTLLTIDLHLPGGLIEGTHDLATARTAGFTVLVFAQLFNCFNARSETTSAFVHLFVNPWLWGAIVLSVLLQVAVVNLDFLNLAFGTAPLEFSQWLLCTAMASVVLWFAELRKLVNRAWSR